MFPRDLQLENWPWRAISRQQTTIDGAMRDLLPGLLRAESLVRRSRFVTANRLVCRHAASTIQPVAFCIEHRLYALFAE